MAHTHNSQEFVRVLQENLKEISQDRYADLTTKENMREKLARKVDSDSAWEEFWEVGAVPDVPLFTGQSLTYLNISGGYHTKIEPKEYAAGLQYERKLMDDKKYPVLENGAAGLGVASNRTMEKLFVNIFVNANSSAMDFQTSEEGKSLCSTTHLTKSGTSTADGFSNSGSSAFSATSLAATRLLMKGFRNDISEMIDSGNNLAIICPLALEDSVLEVVNTKSGLDTAGQNYNPQAANRYTVIPYMRLDDYDTNNWFLVDMDKMKEALLWIERIAPEFNSTIDFQTFVTMISVYFRCAAGTVDWRWIYGHFVT